MNQSEQLITDNLDIWTAAIQNKASMGRGSNKKQELYGVKKLRELILELAVRGLLVPQDPSDEPASVLLEKIAGEKERLVKKGKIKKAQKVQTVGDEETPFNLPDGWVWTRLSEFAQIAPRNESEDGIEVSFIPMPLISTAYDGAHQQESKTWGEVKKGYTHFADGDIAVAKITPCFENSKAAVFSNLKNGIGAGTTELHVARPYSDLIDRNYVLLYLKAPQFLLVGQTKMTGSAGQKRVPKDFFALNPLPLPPETEQPRIVAKVDELMSLCDQLEQQTEASLTAHQTLVETLLKALLDAAQSRDDGSRKESAFEQAWQRIADHFDVLFTTEHSIDQLKQTILQLAVMGKLVPQDPNDEPASVLLEKIAAEKERLVKEGKIKKQKKLPPISEEEKPFELPEGWEWCKFGLLAQFINGDRGKNYPNKSEYVDSGVPWINTGHIEPDGMLAKKEMNYITREKFDSLRSGKIQAEDLVYCLRGATFGKTAFVKPYSEGAIASSLMIIRPFYGQLGPFFYRYLTSSLGRSQISRFDNGSAQPNLSANSVMLYAFPCPPINEQHRIAKKLEDIFKVCDSFKKRVRESQITQLYFADAIAEQAIA